MNAKTILSTKRYIIPQLTCSPKWRKWLMITGLHGMRMIGHDFVQSFRDCMIRTALYHGRRAPAVNNITSRRLGFRSYIHSVKRIGAPVIINVGSCLRHYIHSVKRSGAPVIINVGSCLRHYIHSVKRSGAPVILLTPGACHPGQRGMSHIPNPGGVALTYASAYA